MKWSLLAAISLYWRLTNPDGRRHCLFRQSCSRHVFEMTAENGARAGLRALVRRIRQCRPRAGAAVSAGSQCLLMLADGSTASPAELSAVGLTILQQWLTIPHQPLTITLQLSERNL